MELFDVGDGMKLFIFIAFVCVYVVRLLLLFTQNTNKGREKSGRTQNDHKPQCLIECNNGSKCKMRLYRYCMFSLFIFVCYMRTHINAHWIRWIAILSFMLFLSRSRQRWMHLVMGILCLFRRLASTVAEQRHWSQCLLYLWGFRKRKLNHMPHVCDESACLRARWWIKKTVCELFIRNKTKFTETQNDERRKKKTHQQQQQQ